MTEPIMVSVNPVKVQRYRNIFFIVSILEKLFNKPSLKWQYCHLKLGILILGFIVPRVLWRGRQYINLLVSFLSPSHETLLRAFLATEG